MLVRADFEHLQDPPSFVAGLFILVSFRQAAGHKWGSLSPLVSTILFLAVTAMPERPTPCLTFGQLMSINDSDGASPSQAGAPTTKTATNPTTTPSWRIT